MPRLATDITPAGVRASFPGVGVDRREQEPWKCHAGPLPDCRGWDVLRRYPRTLATGDYCVVGFEQTEAIERKSLADACSTFVGFQREEKDPNVKHANWDRFERELERARALRWFAVVIEGSVDDVLRHRYMGAASPQSILARSFSIMADYGYPVLWAGSREEAERAGGWLLLRRWERHLRSMPLPDALAIINGARERAEVARRAARTKAAPMSTGQIVPTDTDAGETGNAGRAPTSTA